MSQIMQ